MVDFHVDAARTALVNVDFQNCFIDGYPVSAPQGLTVLKRINRLADVCRENGILVIHTAHVVRPDGSNMGVMREIIPLVREGMITEGRTSAALHKELAVKEEDIVLNKPRFGAFHGTDFELILRSRGIDCIIVSGIATNVCCETTAREANVRDFRVFFLSDGTATCGIGDVSAEEIQKVSCAILGLFAQVLTVSEMIAKIKE